MFTLYRGLAGSESAALGAVSAVGAQIYSFGQINADGSPFTANMAIDGSNLTNPTTGPRAFRSPAGAFGGSRPSARWRRASATLFRWETNMSRTGRGVTVVVAVMILAGGCGLALIFRDEVGCRLPLVECLKSEGELFVRNDRTDMITIKVDSSSIVVPPGQMKTLASLGCGGSVLIATDAAGTEVSQLAPDAECGTRTWIFHADGTTQVEPGHA